MAVPDLADTWKCVIHQATDEWTAENVFHVTAASSADAIDVATAAATAWSQDGGIANAQSDEIAYTGVSVQVYDGVSAPVDFGDGLFASTTGRHSAGTTVSPQVAWIITLRSLTSGRKARGRLFVPGISTSFLDARNAAIDPSVATNFPDWAENFRTTLESDPTTDGLVIYSALYNAKFACTSTQSRTYLGTLRSRVPSPY